MQLIDVPRIVWKNYRQRLYFHNITDIHMGAKGCDERQLDKDVKAIRKALDKGEYHFWFVGGDSINGIGPKDKRHDATAVADRFQKYSGQDLFRQQVRAVAEKLLPIREAGLFVGAGNHEITTSKSGEYDPGADLAERLNLPYAGYSAAFRLRLCPKNTNTTSVITCYWHHGFGAARTKGAKANMAQKLREIINVDVYLVGHVHEPISMPDEELSLTRTGQLALKAHEKLIVIGASYLKTYPTGTKPQTSGEYDKDLLVQADYAEQKGYRPSVIGHTGFSLQVCHEGPRGKGEERWRTKIVPEDYR